MTYKPQLARLDVFDAQMPFSPNYIAVPHFDGSVDHALLIGWLTASPDGAYVQMMARHPAAV